MARTDLIRDQLAEHLSNIGVIGKANTPARWLRIPPDRLHTPFGFTVPHHADDAVRVDYCPQLIDQQTGFLNDDDLVDYLHVVEFHLDLHVSHLDEPADQVETMIDRTIANIAMGSLQLANQVQLRALDTR